MNQILLPAEAEIAREVEQLVLAESCVAFIGAGMSNPPGKQWAELMTNIARRCGVELQGQSLDVLADACQDTNPREYDNAFREFFPRHIATARTALSYLLRLPFRAYVTTNVDPWLRNLARAEGIDGAYRYPDLPPLQDGYRAIYCLHGYYDSEDPECDPKKLIFGARAFAQAYGEESLLPGFLLQLFIYKHIVFFGFDPSEEHVRAVLRQANNIRRAMDISQGQVRKRFVLWPALDEGECNEERRARFDSILMVRSFF